MFIVLLLRIMCTSLGLHSTISFKVKDWVNWVRFSVIAENRLKFKIRNQIYDIILSKSATFKAGIID